MKTSNNALLLAVAGLASQASAAVQMDVRFSDNLIDVGNADLFATTWQTLYDTAGNERSVVTDKSVQSFNNPCVPIEDAEKPDLTVQVKMNGAWGQTPGLEQNQMRDGLIQSMWEVLKNVADRNKYDVFTECSGTTWMDSGSADPNAACGRAAARGCEEACKNENSPGLAQCMQLTQGTKVPSELRVTAYIDDQLQADDLIIQFGSTVNQEPGGCGVVGEVAKAVSNFIPVVGAAAGLFTQGIVLGCTGIPQ